MGEIDYSLPHEQERALRKRHLRQVHSTRHGARGVACEELVARSVVVCETPPQLMLSDKIIRLDVSSHVDRAFLSLANNAEHSRAFYVAHASGTSSSMKNVSREVVLSLPVALPPLAEQARIVARVTEIRRLCAELRQRLAASQATQSRLAAALVDQVA